MTSTDTPAWFAPYGEGYCKTCRFMIPLGLNGLLEPHRRGAALAHNGVGDPCPGAFSHPAAPSKTPVTSRLSAFRARIAKKQCPWCTQRVGVVTFNDNKIYFTAHRVSSPGRVLCDGSFRPVEK